MTVLRILMGSVPIVVVVLATCKFAWWANKEISPIGFVQILALYTGAVTLAFGIWTRRMIGLVIIGEKTRKNIQGIRTTRWSYRKHYIGGICLSWKILVADDSNDTTKKNQWLDIRGLISRKARQCHALKVCGREFNYVNHLVESRPLGVRYDISYALLDGECNTSDKRSLGYQLINDFPGGHIKIFNEETGYLACLPAGFMEVEYDFHMPGQSPELTSPILTPEEILDVLKPGATGTVTFTSLIVGASSQDTIHAEEHLRKCHAYLKNNNTLTEFANGIPIRIVTDGVEIQKGELQQAKITYQWRVQTYEQARWPSGLKPKSLCHSPPSKTTTSPGG